MSNGEWTERDWSEEVTAGNAVVFYSKSSDQDAQKLSNLYSVTVELDGEKYASAEHAFQLLKMKKYGKNDAVKELREYVSPVTIKKKAGKRGLASATLTDAQVLRWNSGEAEDTMVQVLRAKFSTPEMSRILIATGSKVLIERVQPRGDKIWGVNKKYIGCNKTGRALMLVRQELKDAEKA